MTATELERKHIKGYEVLEMIGVGGFGAVYRAVQPLLGREVAIKVILPEYANSDEFIRRFETEAQLVARLEHPHIVPLFDYWREPDSAYLVMRYVRGGSLTENLQRKGAWSPEDTLRLLEQIGGALHIAHRNKVVHRDIKPDNILLDGDGNAYLTDFGIARLAGKSEVIEDGISGSLGYMAPEQLLGVDVNPQADIYSLALVLYELLTGEAAYDTNDSEHLITRRLDEVSDSPITLRADLPEAIKSVLFRATFNAASARYGDVRELIQEFRRAISLHLDAGSIYSIDLSNVINPYKGLRSFEQADADDFFGREALIHQLLLRMQEEVWASRFLAVVGPSGSGKSSVVKAGLIPALRRNSMVDSERWFYVEMVPGYNPVSALESAILSVALRPPTDFHTRLLADPNALLAASRSIPGELLLFVDQFEEVFTLCDSEVERIHFLNLLHRAVTASESRIRIIVTLRADYYDRPLLHKGFGALIQMRTQVVLPLSAREIEQAIVGPANRANLLLDPDLVATMIADISAEPGGLPLLQYALTELFEQRDGLRLTVVAYANIGGASGVLAKRAEEIYRSLSPHLQPLARYIFLRMITISEGQNDTRRRVRRAELFSLAPGTSTGEINQVLNAFGRFRLLTFDFDAGTREPMVEIAHEALLRTWSTLREWLQQNRENIHMERQLANLAHEWERHRRSPDFLLQGGRLDQFEQWMETADLSLTPDEQEYLALSLVERQRLDRIDSERREREFRLQRRNLIGARLVIIGALTATLLTFLLAASALYQRRNAEIARATSDANLALAVGAQSTSVRQAEQANSMALAANALLLAERDPLTAISLAMEAVRYPTPSSFATRALSEIAYAPRQIEQIYQGHKGSLNAAAFSPDGHLLLTAAYDQTIRLWDAATGQQLKIFRGHQGGITAAQFLPDGKHIISSSTDRTVRVWNIITGETNTIFRGQDTPLLSMAVSADGKLAITGGEDGSVCVWSVETGDLYKKLLGHSDGINGIALSRDSRFILSGGRDGLILMWDSGTGNPLLHLQRDTIVGAVAFSPDGSTFLTGEFDGMLRLWETGSGKLLRTLEGHSDLVDSVVYSPDGKSALSGSFDQTLIEWDVTIGQLKRRFVGHVGAVNIVNYSLDGTEAISGSTDLKAIRWSLRPPRHGALVRTDTGHSDWVNAVDMSPDGTLEVSGGLDGKVIFWDAVQGVPLYRRLDHASEVYTAHFIPRRGSNGHWQVLTGGQDGTLFQWDAETGILLRVLVGHRDAINAISFTADGTMALTASADKTLILWELSSGKAVRKFIGHMNSVNSVVLLPDGKLAVSGGSDQVLLLWNVSTGKPIRELMGHNGPVWRVVVNNGGDRAYSASTDGTIIEWDLTTGATLRTFVGHTSIIWALAISDSGQWLASGADDRTIILWSTDTGQAARYYQTDAIAFDLTFDNTSRLLIAAMSDQTIAHWRIDDLESLIRWTQDNRIVRELTCAERITYNVTPLC